MKLLPESTKMITCKGFFRNLSFPPKIFKFLQNFVHFLVIGDVFLSLKCHFSQAQLTKNCFLEFLEIAFINFYDKLKV